MKSGEFAEATIVFDLDGTLVDTAPDLVRALNATLDLEGLPRVRAEVVRGLVGHGARNLIERAAGLSGVQFGAERLDQLTQAYIQFYREDIAAASAPFPGVTEALAALADAGAALSVCTNKRTDLSVQLLDALDLSRYFAVIVGADAVAERKPHPDHFRAAVTRAGGDVRRSIMIGDTAADVASARGAGAPVAIVSFGYSDVGADELGADALLHHYAELPEACRRLLNASAQI